MESWSQIYESSGYRLATLAEMAKIDEGSFRKYLRGDRTPRDKNNQKMERVMLVASQLPRLKYDPSYGYATAEQIEELKRIGLGPTMDRILKEIEEQTRNRGKFK